MSGTRRDFVPNGDGPKSDSLDAGVKSLDHYKRALPRWRYVLRQNALPLIRWETPYLAWMQERLRTPALDSYFAITANLGTHTFFMIGLPICFWCGYASVGKALVHMLAFGVFWTGFIKDFFSLPRPLSPPLHRITMSGSVALEYGFPSTHSANAVSVALYTLLCLRSPESTISPTATFVLEFLAYSYAVSIIFGRLYCGMHGFIDVIVGSLFGAGIALLDFYYAPALDGYIHSCSWLAPVTVGIVIVILVRIHPEPADDCPCFDDSVAFAGTVIGVELGTWSYGKIPGDPWETHAFGEGVVNVAPLGIWMNIARILLGVLLIFAWRETTKPFLLKYLPYLFRFIERLGLSLPRRFFTPATEYKSVPSGSRLDTLFPTASDFPRMVEGIRHPTTRGRSISIGPQSAADAYEALAYRERRRRESVGSNKSVVHKPSLGELNGKEGDQSGKGARATGARSTLKDYEEMMGTTEGPGTTKDSHSNAIEGKLEEKEVFSKITKPRIRYDIEVVTKLVVYTGIGLVATAVVPLVFEIVGLGTNHLQSR